MRSICYGPSLLFWICWSYCAVVLGGGVCLMSTLLSLLGGGVCLM
jgi:hypothetical protein